MEEQFAPTPSTFPKPPNPRRRRLGMFMFMVALLVVVLFGYRVFRYYRQIQTGTLAAPDLQFESTRASQNKLLAIAQAAPGSGKLATADDPVLGPASAKLTIVEFADFGCPYSQEENYVVTALAKQYPNDVRIIYRDFPLIDIHPGANLAAEAAQCAYEQNKFWEYHDVLYRNSGEFTEETLLDYASQISLNQAKFETCLTSRKYSDEVAQDLADGVAAGVSGTPTFFLNGQKIEGAIPFATFKSVVEAFIAEQPTP